MQSATASRDVSKEDDATRTREVYPASPPAELNAPASLNSRQNSTGRAAGGILDSERAL